MHVQLLDQTAVEHRKRRAAGSRGLEGRHNAAAVLELGGRGREGAVGRGEGLRVDERLAIKAEGAALCSGRGACMGRACMGRVRVAWGGCGVGGGCVGVVTVGGVPGDEGGLAPLQPLPRRRACAQLAWEPALLTWSELTDE